VHAVPLFWYTQVGLEEVQLVQPDGMQTHRGGCVIGTQIRPLWQLSSFQHSAVHEPGGVPAQPVAIMMASEIARINPLGNESMLILVIMESLRKMLLD
jgi:hypothetical protein